MKKKILISGAEGYVGSNLKKYFSEDYSILSLSHKIGKNQRKNIFEADITDLKTVENVIKKVTPDVLIHTAAVSNLSECEKNKDHAHAVNFSGTKNIVDTIIKFNLKTKLVFFSSDYVFDGEKGDYKEDDLTVPKTVYGITKLKAENYILEKLENIIICRTANVFGDGGSFFRFVTEAIEKSELIKVYDNVFYTPTYVHYLIESLIELIKIDFKGIIHIAGREKVSRYQFAIKVAEAIGKDKNQVRSVKQPIGGLISADSSLNTNRLSGLINNFCPDLEQSLNYCFGNTIPPYFYFGDSRGKILGITQEKQKWEEANYIEAVRGSERGNHYHKETKEIFFIIQGKIKIVLRDLTGNGVKSFLAKKGDIVIVEPNVVHTFFLLEDSRWINMLTKAMRGNKKDFYKP